MWLRIIRFCSTFFTAIAMSFGLAHLFALPNKIGLSKENYLIVQQIYRGWALSGIIIVLALLSTLLLTGMVRMIKREFALTLTALLCMVAAQILFWVFTFPANRITNNWTVLPENWMVLRKQWEYSHAVSAVLAVIAFVTLIIAQIIRKRSRSSF